MAERAPRGARSKRPAGKARRGDSRRRFGGVTRWLLVGLLVAIVLVAGYFFWFKGSSLVAVEDVEVTGVDVSPSVAARLENTALGMSTLDLDRGALEAAVADDPSVVGLKMETDFPHGLTIDVQSRRAVGWWDVDGGTVVAADGVVLTDGIDRPDGVPVIEADAEGETGERVKGPALALAKVLGGAPQPLLELSEKAWMDGEIGPVVEVEGGIELRFGDPSSAAAKWRAAASVLADPELTSARYIDLSAPTRPAAG